MLTQERVKELFDYSPSKGQLIGKINWYRRKKGEQADFLHVITGYLRVSIDGERFRSQRVIWLWMTGVWPKNQIDHINGDRSDNRWINLRDVTNRENALNTKLRCDNKSGYPGVCLNTSRKKDRWETTIYVDKKRILLGYFYDKQEAINTRKEAEIKYGYHKNHGRN